MKPHSHSQPNTSSASGDATGLLPAPLLTPTRQTPCCSLGSAGDALRELSSSLLVGSNSPLILLPSFFVSLISLARSAIVNSPKEKITSFRFRQSALAPTSHSRRGQSIGRMRPIDWPHREPSTVSGADCRNQKLIISPHSLVNVVQTRVFDLHRRRSLLSATLDGANRSAAHSLSIGRIENPHSIGRRRWKSKPRGCPTLTRDK